MSTGKPTFPGPSGAGVEQKINKKVARKLKELKDKQLDGEENIEHILGNLYSYLQYLSKQEGDMVTYPELLDVAKKEYKGFTTEDLSQLREELIKLLNSGPEVSYKDLEGTTESF